MPIEQQELTAAVEKSIRELDRVFDDIQRFGVRRFDGGETRRAFAAAGDSVRNAINQLGVAWASAARESDEDFVEGTRVPTAAIRQFSEAGYTAKQIIREYPVLTPANIKAALSQEINRRSEKKRPRRSRAARGLIVPKEGG